MKKIIITLSAVFALVLVSCKEDATSKIINANVQVAEQRDADAKKIPVMSFDKTEHDFGTISANAAQETLFKFTNTGNAPLVITSATSTCGCTVPEVPKAPIAPGESGELLVKFNGAGANAVSKVVTVTANTAKGTEQLTIKAFVTPANQLPAGPLKQS
ncbi:MAG: DUF1573 domain-containing protein [Cellulophaga sp.]|nr:DUF1573 domain-containing protein [Cellulophaga sp.]